MRKNVLFALFFSLSLWIPVFAQEVQSPWVSTDRTVDNSSYQTILQTVIKPGMKDEEKVIAIYNYFRQMVYHYVETPEGRNPLILINGIGNTLCGSQGTCMVGILEEAGIKGRVVTHPGHTFFEAFYDGKWHGFDTMSNFYVFTRGENRNVASFEELAADPTLISTAVAEGRAAPNWVPCGDDPMAFKDKINVLNYKANKDANWNVKNYSLRPGEEIVRSWWPQGYPLPGTQSGKDKYPHHTCGGKDDANPPEIFKFWEPYLIRNFERVSRSFRHYFNGFVNYSPDMNQPEIQSQLANKSYSIPVSIPFYISGGKLYFVAATEVAEDSIEVFVTTKGAEKSVFKTDGIGEKQYKVDLYSAVVKSVPGYRAYTLRFALNGNAKLKQIYLRTIFTHNAMSAPHLMPGKNNVTLTVGNPDSLKTAPITVVYRYKEAPSWSAEKTIEKTLNTSPVTFEVSIAETDKLPQMQDMTLRNGKLAWYPVIGTVPDKVLCDFSKADSITGWGADDPLKITHDGTGMLIASDVKSKQSQVSFKVEENLTAYTDIVIEMENLGSKQEVVFRARSNDSNEERTDVSHAVPKGKFVMKIPTSSLTKVKLDKVTKIYLMMLNSPDNGCNVRVNKISFITDKSL